MSPYGMLIQLLTPLHTWTMGQPHFPSGCKLALCKNLSLICLAMLMNSVVNFPFEGEYQTLEQLSLI